MLGNGLWIFRLDSEFLTTYRESLLEDLDSLTVDYESLEMDNKKLLTH
jgi:hypothetical protein